MTVQKGITSLVTKYVSYYKKHSLYVAKNLQWPHIVLLHKFVYKYSDNIFGVINFLYNSTYFMLKNIYLRKGSTDCQKGM